MSAPARQSLISPTIDTSGASRLVYAAAYVAKLLISTGSRQVDCVRPLQTTESRIQDRLLAGLQTFLDDKDNFEDGEDRPTPVNIERMRTLLRQLSAPEPPHRFASFYGELTVAWEKGERFLQFIIPRDESLPVKVFRADMSAGVADDRSEPIDIDASSNFTQYFNWLDA